MKRGFRATVVTATFLALSVLLQPLSPIANSVPGGVAYSGDTRSVPIFAVMQVGGRQPTQVVTSGFLYSSRIVFTAGVQDRLFDQAKGGIYVGKPGSKTTDLSGRVKVIKAFYPNSGEAELNDFVVFVLEKELASVEPFPLLQVGQEYNVREASVRGYGEYQDRCGPAAQGPCPEKPTSEISRQINVNVISLSQAETLVGYERPQLMGQIFLQNVKSAQDGVVCRGDTGSPVIGNLSGTGVYLGAASRAMNAKICGAVGVEKVERDKPKVSTSFDGIAGITHIAPVYRFSSVIDEARNYAARTAEDALDKNADPLTSNKEYICGASPTQMPGFTVQRDGKNVLYAWSKQEADEKFRVLFGEVYFVKQGENPPKLPKDSGTKRVCSFLDEGGNKALSLLYDLNDNEEYSAARKLIFRGEKRISDKNQWVFIFSHKKDGGITYDFSPVRDRDGSLNGRLLKKGCEISWFALPVVRGVGFYVNFGGKKIVKASVANLAAKQRFLYGVSSIGVSASTVVVTEKVEINTSIEMAEATITIVSDQVNQINKGQTLEIFFPNTDKSTILKIRSVKTYASKGLTAIKTVLAVEEFAKFAYDVYMAPSNKKEAERICPSLN